VRSEIALTLSFAWREFNQQVQMQEFWLDQLPSSTLILVTGQRDKWLDTTEWTERHKPESPTALISYQSKTTKNFSFFFCFQY
jgi:hypothetical protein